MQYNYTKKSPPYLGRRFFMIYYVKLLSIVVECSYAVEFYLLE